MPIAVDCPKCDATLSAPDSSAGKKIRCPECQALVSVPSMTLQFAEEEPPSRDKPRPRKKKARVPDDDDNRPRKKRTKPRAVTEEDDEDDEEDDSPGYSGRPSKIPPPVWIAYAACLLAILIGIGVSISIISDAQERERLAREGKLVPTGGGAGGVEDTTIDPGGMPDPQDNP